VSEELSAPGWLVPPLFAAIVAGDETAVARILAAEPGLAGAALRSGATRQEPRGFYLPSIGHHVVAGDTPLHVASAAHRPALVRRLLADGADVGARNRRGASPLHYAADGSPDASDGRAADHAATIEVLLAAGADPNARNMDGVAPLHRAVRTRSAVAVRALLEGGADPRLPNGNGSTPVDLALRTTGKSGSGTPAARAQQAAIVALLEAAEPLT